MPSPRHSIVNFSRLISSSIALKIHCQVPSSDRWVDAKFSSFAVWLCLDKNLRKVADRNEPNVIDMVLKKWLLKAPRTSSCTS